MRNKTKIDSLLYKARDKALFAEEVMFFLPIVEDEIFKAPDEILKLQKEAISFGANKEELDEFENLLEETRQHKRNFELISKQFQNDFQKNINRTLSGFER